MFEQKHTKFIKLLNLLKLESYETEFLEAIKYKSYKCDYTTKHHQERLNKIFNLFFQPVVDDNNESIEPCVLVGESAKDKLNIKDEHINDIFNSYEFINKSDKEKVQLLLILSGIFATFSSFWFFGTEYNSPTALRYYAYGLMKAAQKLNNTIIPDFNNVENNKW